MNEVERLVSQTLLEAQSERHPSLVDRMTRSLAQFTTDVARANADARQQLGETAVEHMLSGVAPILTGLIGDIVLERVLQPTLVTEEVAQTLSKFNLPLDSVRPPIPGTDRKRGQPVRHLLADVVTALNERPFLKEVAKNVGVTVGYNQFVVRPSEGALPPANAVDAGIAVGVDAAAIGTEKVLKGDHVLIKGAKFANGPTVLGLRMMAEGVAALAKNYQAIQHARKHPNEPKPWRPPEHKPWERRDRGGRRDFHNRDRDRVYYGQGGGRYDRQHR